MVKYLCKSCKTECDDITEHMTKVHKFSKWIMEIQLKTNPNTYKNCFETKAQTSVRLYLNCNFWQEICFH